MRRQGRSIFEQLLFGLRMVNHLNLHLGIAILQQTNFEGCPLGKIDDATLAERPPVVDAHHHSPQIL